MYPDRRTALKLLYEAHENNPGPWLGHSLTCAHCAEHIAYHAGMDPDKAYVLGLLHDIGRKFGKRHLGHVSDGYTYMMSLGYDDAARICLSHSFNDKDINAYVGNFDTGEAETKLIREKLAEAVFDDYDLLIQLCDAISGSDEVMDIIERMSDVKRRYGEYDRNKWDKNLYLKSYFEEKMGMDVYQAVDKDHYRTLDIYLKEEPVCVIGHQNPDSDSICSMIACADLLNRVGINAQAVVSDKIGKESEFLLSIASIEAPERKDDIQGKKVILVDHGDISQSCFRVSEEDIIGIIDHHDMEKRDREGMYVFRNEKIGATTTMIYQLYQEKGIEMPKKIAMILLGGLLSDTRNMKANVRQDDVIAFDDLLLISGVKDTDRIYQKLRKAYLDHEGMDDMEIFLSDYKEYVCAGIRYGISVVAVNGTKNKIDMMKRMDQVMKKHHDRFDADVLFAKVKDEKAGNMYMSSYGAYGEMILDHLSSSTDGSFHVFEKSLSRKKHLVPMIEAYINDHFGKQD